VRILTGRHRLIAEAMTLATHWCAGHHVAGEPALDHAYQVATTITAYEPDARPEPLAAALIHDSPDFAPHHLDLNRVLTERLSPAVATIIDALHLEHHTLEPAVLHTLTDTPDAVLVSAADHLVSITRALTRPDGPRPGLTAALPYFQAFTETTRPHLPHQLAEDLTQLVHRARITPARPSPAR
jgi:hypothetical protein